METTSFWRKSALWWGMCVAMILSGTSTALGFAGDGSRVSLGLSIGALVLAAISAVAVARTWILHRRERAAK